MSGLQNNVRFTWELVSQFISWEFCRYMWEERENNSLETDILTYLRNMIVQRTEKSMSEITKHEIVAKFIMEIKEVQHISRMSCIIPLSESIKKIIPELEPTISKLVHHLETFLSVLESTIEERRDLIRLRIEDAINDFLKEANRVLPQPHILQVVESWKSHRGYTNPRPRKKVVYTASLFEKVLECMHYETITPSEAKIIAVSLYKDKVFEKILRNAEAEPETEADSEQFSFSVQSSQPSEHVYSEEFVRNSEAIKIDKIQNNLLPPNPEHQDPDSLELDNCVPPIHDEIQNVYNMPQSYQQPPCLLPAVSMHPVSPPSVLSRPVSPPPVLSRPVSSNPILPPPVSVPSVSPLPQPPPAYPFIHRDNSAGFVALNNETHNHMQFAQSSANESPSDECNSSVEEYVTKKFKKIYENIKINKTKSDSDTSDCDKNGEIRFLTPTLFRKTNKKKASTKKAAPKSQVVWLSDLESNDSSIITNPISSQKNDPNWTQGASFYADFKRVKSKPSKKTVHPKKKKVRMLNSESSDDEPIITGMPGQSASHQNASTSALHNDSESEIPIKKRRTVKLYSSPNMSIEDFVYRTKRQDPVASIEAPVPDNHNTRTLRKRLHEPKSARVKKEKCKKCSKAFKTRIALRRHVFLKHTEPLEDSDDD